MSKDANNSDGQVFREMSLPPVKDPALVVAYFFNGSDQDGNRSAKHLVDDVFHQLAQELNIHASFRPTFLRPDTRSLSFKRYQWNEESRAALALFGIEPSDVWCIQLGLPVCDGHVPVKEALRAWQEMERQLKDWIGGKIEAIWDEHPELYWGSSRLHWGLSDELAVVSEQSQSLVGRLRDIAYPKKAEQGGDIPEQSVVRVQDYEPRGREGEHGALWRLDEPAVGVGAYQAAWLLLSPQAQENPVMVDYVFNGRFAVGEAYLCKAHYQAGKYSPVAEDLKTGVRTVQEKLMRLLKQAGPSGFEVDQIDQAQRNMHRREERMHDVSKAYSRLLVTTSLVDRLHLTVKTNLDNYEKGVKEFSLWEHPAARAEILRLRGVLNQIEHDLQSWQASLDTFHAALETIRAGLDLTGDRVATARLDLEQEQAAIEKRKEEADRWWDVFTVLIGTVLSVSQIIPLTYYQRIETFRWSAPVVVVLFLVFVVGRRIARSRG